MDTNHNVTWHKQSVTRGMREREQGHRSCVIWFTGLSGSGKSTLANVLELSLASRGIRTYLLDGDNVRQGLTQDLGFSREDRRENIRRVAQAAKLFVDAGVVVIAAMISPLREDRSLARKLFAPEEFIEVFIDCPLDVCMERDPKGLYKKAQSGLIPEFTGISSPYERPENPDISIRTHELPIEKAAEQILTYVHDQIALPIELKMKHS